jgi:serine/threonine-protein kinase
MSGLESETLERRLERGPLPIQLAADIALQLAHALDRARGKQMGVPRRLLASISLIEQPWGGCLVHVTDLEPATENVDNAIIQAVGAVLYQMVTGLSPFTDGRDEIQSIIDLRPDCPQRLTDIIQECLETRHGPAFQELIAVLGSYAASSTPALLPDVSTIVTAEGSSQFATAVVPVEASTAPDSASSGADPWKQADWRYIDLGLIGRGGMGEVRRVHDRYFGRTLAMKILRLKGAYIQERFIDEARITAQLQHPAIVPVHDIGNLPDGRLYFTMKEIKGKTLAEVIQEAHQDSSRWSLRQLISVLQRICEGVGYAHSQGALHRDLKPKNLMIGDFGEALVLDWGLTRLFSAVEQEEEPGGEHATYTREFATRVGMVVGTPVFMSPEQASGKPELVTVASDVYSLGAVLYNILDGRPPYDHVPRGTLPVLQGPPPPLGKRPSINPRGPVIPDELKAISERAMARDPANRYENAAALAAALGAWLEGVQRRERAMRVLDEARGLRVSVAALLNEAGDLEATASRMLEQLPPSAPVESKRPVWELQDRALALKSQAQFTDTRYVQLVRAALTHAGDLEQAHALLADYFQEQHAKAEAARDSPTAASFEILLRDHDDGRFADYLKGDGVLTVDTDPPGASVLLYRYQEEGRRLIPSLVSRIGASPIEQHSLPMGSYLLRISHPERIEVNYPVFIERLRHWNGVRPGSSRPRPIYLPRRDEIGPDECYVPAGWFWSGGDPRARNSLPAQRLWLEGFVMTRFPITLGEYVAFLNDLVHQGKEDQALTHVPPLPAWEEGKTAEQQRELGVIRDSAGRFRLDGPEDKLRWPVTMINWFSATAYGEWRAERDGLAWRLPSEMEHEKAARGVDGRPFPWGHYLDPTFCCMRLSHPNLGRVLKALVDDYPVDESPYGIRGLAGNTFCWCIDPFTFKGPQVVDGIPVVADPAKISGPGAGGVHRIVRGGTWRDPEEFCRAAYRDGPPAVYRDTTMGFRLVRELP